MAVPERARLVRIELEGELSAAEGCLLVRGDEHPFGAGRRLGRRRGDRGLGAAAGGGDGRGPLRPARSPAGGGGCRGRSRRASVAAGSASSATTSAHGSSAYRLPRRGTCRCPTSRSPSTTTCCGSTADGRWWFEALWTDERDAELRARLELLRARLAEGVRERPVWVGTFQPAPPGGAGHMTAIDECRERIAAGEIFQANLCLRLEAEWKGDPLDLFARTAGTLEPRHAGVVAGPWGAVCSLSPELFLRRRGREVVSEPIKGTAPRVLAADCEGTRAEDTRAALAASTKDRAENVMIVDLMRNDLGRVCEYGSIRVPALTEPRPAPGVWHLVSTVTGTLRPDAGDADLLRASFPPGSVTGAPKIQAMRVIAELEAGGREAYTGALGYASPVAGLELNVAIRTLEMRGERIWMGAGGGIVTDSVAERELEECFVKARPVIAAAGARLIEEPRVSRVAPIPALAGGADRPDPALGVFETLLVRGGSPVDARAHLARLERSVSALYGESAAGGSARASRGGRCCGAARAPTGDRCGRARLCGHRRARSRPARRDSGRAARGRAGARAGHALARRPSRRPGRAQMAGPPAARRAGRPAPGRAPAPRPRRRRARGRVRERVHRGGDPPRHPAARRPPTTGHRAGAGARAASRARGEAVARPDRRCRRGPARVIRPWDPPGTALRWSRTALPAWNAPTGGPPRGRSGE